MTTDPVTFQKIKLYRAFHDPPIPHPPRQDTLDDLVPEYLFEDMIHGRLNQVEATPASERIDRVTWPETVIYCSTASMDGRSATAAFAGLYQYTFRQYLAADYTQGVPEILPEPTQIEITDEHRDIANELRIDLKHERDKQFLAHAYDELPFDPTGVPKTTWRQAATALAEIDTTDDDVSPEDETQTSLSSF